jgi:cytoskeletal protein CcmA (bactofilin family)
MFRKGKQVSSSFGQTHTRLDELEDDSPSKQEAIKEEPMVNRDRSVTPSSDGGGTLLSADAEFKGSLKFGDELRVDGSFEGEMTSDGTVHVGPDGDVKADIKVGNAVVEGKVNGNITASDRVELRATAKMIGDIKAAKMIVEEGVVFVGRCEVSSDKAKLPAAGAKKESQPADSPLGVGLGA